jgi:hypothetical protein
MIDTDTISKEEAWKWLKDSATSCDLKLRDFCSVVRFFVTGSNIGPPLDEVISFFGRKKTMTRIHNGLRWAEEEIEYRNAVEKFRSENQELIEKLKSLDIVKYLDLWDEDGNIK